MRRIITKLLIFIVFFIFTASYLINFSIVKAATDLEDCESLGNDVTGCFKAEPPCPQPHIPYGTCKDVTNKITLTYKKETGFNPNNGGVYWAFMLYTYPDRRQGGHATCDPNTTGNDCTLTISDDHKTITVVIDGNAFPGDGGKGKYAAELYDWNSQRNQNYSPDTFKIIFDHYPSNGPLEIIQDKPNTYWKTFLVNHRYKFFLLNAVSGSDYTWFFESQQGLHGFGLQGVGVTENWPHALNGNFQFGDKIENHDYIILDGANQDGYTGTDGILFKTPGHDTLCVAEGKSGGGGLLGTVMLGCEGKLENFNVLTSEQEVNIINSTLPLPPNKSDIVGAGTTNPEDSYNNTDTSNNYGSYTETISSCSSGSQTNQCLSVNTGLGISIGTKPTTFIGSLFAFLLSIAGMIALFLIIQSGYVMMTSSGNPEKIQGAKETLTSAIVGLLFIIFSLAILQIISADILKLPGFSK